MLQHVIREIKKSGNTISLNELSQKLEIEPGALERNAGNIVLVKEFWEGTKNYLWTRTAHSLHANVGLPVKAMMVVLSSPGCRRPILWIIVIKVENVLYLVKIRKLLHSTIWNKQSDCKFINGRSA